MRQYAYNKNTYFNLFDLVPCSGTTGLSHILRYVRFHFETISHVRECSSLNLQRLVFMFQIWHKLCSLFHIHILHHQSARVHAEPIPSPHELQPRLPPLPLRGAGTVVTGHGAHLNPLGSIPCSTGASLTARHPPTGHELDTIMQEDPATLYSPNNLPLVGSYLAAK